jgi:7,8-dihydropterin-6-yl-methyl-4-(beta-D-ribofuranosyl)aminobenzene 5'-phosphate synthase
LVRVFLFIGLFLSLVACCSPGVISLERASPEYSNQVVPSVSVNASIPTKAVPKMGFTPTSTTLPGIATKTSEEVWETRMPVTQSLTITVVYNNNRYDQRLKPAWGFSALVEYRDHALLFDAGGDGKILMENMRILGIDPTQIESVVLSHAHEDHTGGVNALLEAGARPTVYLLPSFPPSFKRQIGRITAVVEVLQGQFIIEGVFTTGEMDGSIPEQALVIKTNQGLVILTGCAHPGIVEILEQAKALFAEPVYLVMGGFHLGGKSEVEISTILREFKCLGVGQVAPCHCTGDLAIAMFKAEYGEDFIQAGVGRVVRVDGACQ